MEIFYNSTRFLNVSMSKWVEENKFEQKKFESPKKKTFIMLNLCWIQIEIQMICIMKKVWVNIRNHFLQVINNKFWLGQKVSKRRRLYLDISVYFGQFLTILSYLWRWSDEMTLSCPTDKLTFIFMWHSQIAYQTEQAL